MALSIPNTPTPGLEIFDSRDASTSLMRVARAERVAAVNGFTTPADIVALGATIGANGIVASGQVNATKNAADRQWNTATLLAQAESGQGSCSSTCQPWFRRAATWRVRRRTLLYALNHSGTTLGTVHFDAVSSAEGKDDVQEWKPNVDALRSLRLRRFRRKIENVDGKRSLDRPEVGLIVEEVERLWPDVVVHHPQMGPNVKTIDTTAPLSCTCSASSKTWRPRSPLSPRGATWPTTRSPPSRTRPVSCADPPPRSLPRPRSSGTGDTEFAREWTTERSWDLAATPGWADAWESAEASGITDPGASETVITDAMILSRVQPLLVLFPLPEPPAP